jgi:hypothetical protein
MPIEIRELVVRARIDPGTDPAPGSDRSGGGGRGGRRGQDERDLVRACVQEALRAVADHRER